ncbi:histone H2B subacrosomal variant-like [Rhynchocyon petersi]
MAKSNMKQHKSSRRPRKAVSSKSLHSGSNFDYRNFSLYVSRVLKEVAPQRGISSRTLGYMNTMINSLLESIAMEASNQLYFRNRRTLTPEDIQRAVYLLLPGKLAQRAVAFASEAVNRYVHS